MKINEAVRQMHPPRYTVNDAARLVGKDADTLKRWKRNKIAVPSDSRKFGNLTVGLYTDEDIVVMKQIARTMKPGRKPKTT